MTYQSDPAAAELHSQNFSLQDFICEEVEEASKSAKWEETSFSPQSNNVNYQLNTIKIVRSFSCHSLWKTFQEIITNSLLCVSAYCRQNKMSVKDFQAFIAADPQILATGNCVKKVNLLKLHVPPGGIDAAASRKPRGRGMPLNMNPMAAMTQSRVALVLDAEQCLDRLYGGCFPGTCHFLRMSYLYILRETLKNWTRNLSQFFCTNKHNL